MPNDPSIKCQGLYESLKKQGYSKSEAARISNGLWRKGECTGKRKEKHARHNQRTHGNRFGRGGKPGGGAAAMEEGGRDVEKWTAGQVRRRAQASGGSPMEPRDKRTINQALARAGATADGRGVSQRKLEDEIIADLKARDARSPLSDMFRGTTEAGYRIHAQSLMTQAVRDGVLIDRNSIAYQGIGGGSGRFASAKEYKEKNMSEFLVTKDAKGNYRWVLISSSAYVDRDGEIVTEKALVRAVERMDETGDYGQLRWWHTGVVLGDADFAAVHAHQLIESGTFVNKSVAAAVAVAAQGLGASIGFKHPPTQPRNKQYEDIAIQERSILPRGKESNLFTQLSVTGGRMDETKKAALFDLLGEEEATALLSRADVTAKAADDAGFTRKENKGWFQRLKEAFAEIPEPVEEAEEEGDELELTDDEPAAVTDETKAAKEDDMDEAPVTRAEFMKLAARIDELLGERKKETDTLATKEEVAQVAAVVAPVVTIQQETVKRLGEVEKQVQTLTSHELPRGVAGVFRASQAATTATDKAAALGEKMKQSNDPLDGWVAEKFGA